jgi:glycosyltransferase involved in cell wall biosynthesis
MACGTPVVASTAPALREVLGDAALFVEPAEVEGWATAIRRIVEDEPLRGRLAERGLGQAAHFRWEAAAQGYLDLYRRIAA